MSHTRWDYASLIRERGFRVTPQRQLILDAICEGGGHSTPEEIYARVRAKSSAVNRATVYRALDFLCSLQLVVAAEVGGHRVYEIAGDTPHHHLVCRACGHQQEVSHDSLKALIARVEREQHFHIDVNHLALTGLCAACYAAEHAAEPAPLPPPPRARRPARKAHAAPRRRTS